MLEYEEGFNYLGLAVIPTGCSFHLEVLVPGYQEIEHCEPYPPLLYEDRWRYRTSKSSGSEKGLLVGFQSRLHNAACYASPASRGREAVAKLLAVAMVTGHNKTLVRHVFMKQAKRHPQVYAKEFVSSVVEALKRPTSIAIRLCRRQVGVARSQH